MYRPRTQMCHIVHARQYSKTVVLEADAVHRRVELRNVPDRADRHGKYVSDQNADRRPVRDDDDALTAMLCGDRAHAPCDALLEYGKILTVWDVRMLRITVKMLQRLGILGVDLTEEAPFPCPEVKFAQGRIGDDGQPEPRCKRCRRLA